jgi:hypothetical protein
MGSLTSEAGQQRMSVAEPPLGGRRSPHFRKEHGRMLTLAIILLILWALGFITSYTMGGLIHLLLIVAIVIIVIRVIQGRRVL